MQRGRRGGLIVVLVALLAACGGSEPAATPSPPALNAPRPTLPAPTTTSVPPTSSSTSSTPPTTEAPPTTVPDPVAAGDPVYLATQIVTAESAIRDPATPPEELATMARLQQVAYRQLGVHPEWDADVLARVPANLQHAVQLNAAARREFRAMVTRLSTTVPAWRIIEPHPAGELLDYYQEAQTATGVPWQYLAAINLVESGMGRIQGLSTAGAQGPMQFIASTWATWGEGDVNDPHDAILAAARYLAHNGGASGNIAGALFNYNRHPNYVRGVEAYAEVIAAEPRAYLGYHAWEVYYLTTMGDVHLPVGYEEAAPVPVTDYLATRP